MKASKKVTKDWRKNIIQEVGVMLGFPDPISDCSGDLFDRELSMVRKALRVDPHFYHDIFHVWDLNDFILMIILLFLFFALV